MKFAPKNLRSKLHYEGTSLPQGNFTCAFGANFVSAQHRAFLKILPYVAVPNALAAFAEDIGRKKEDMV